MISKLKLIAFLIALVAVTAATSEANPLSEFYLISSTPTPLGGGPFPSRLYAIDHTENNSLKLISELILRQTGTNFVKAYHDERVVVFGSPPVNPVTLTVLYMDQPFKQSTLDATPEQCAKCSIFDPHLLKLPKGSLAHFYVVGRSGSVPFFPLIVSIPEGSKIESSWEYIKYALAAGIPGGLTPGDAFYVLVKSGGKLLISEGKEGIETDWRIPDENWFGKDDTIVAYINNNDILALSSKDNKRKTSVDLSQSTYYFLEKATATWRVVTFPGSRTEIRGFGLWIAGYVADEARKVPSPGIEKRRKAITETGMPVDWRFESEIYAPGILFFYNVHTQKEYRIETAQGDSEILLIDGGQVYYRVNDEIFKAAIEEKTIGQPALLAKGVMVPDIHWAFMGPSIETAPVGGKNPPGAKKEVIVKEETVEKSNWLARMKERAFLIGFVIAGVLLIGGGAAWGMFRYLSKRRSEK